MLEHPREARVRGAPRSAVDLSDVDAVVAREADEDGRRDRLDDTKLVALRKEAADEAPIGKAAGKGAGKGRRQHARQGRWRGGRAHTCCTR